jgi:hypothetical protein
MAMGHGGGGPSKSVSNHSALAQPAPPRLFHEGSCRFSLYLKVHTTQQLRLVFLSRDRGLM